MNIAIVEDNKQDARLLAALLKSYQEQQHLELHFTWYSSSETFLTSAASESFHLIFMDIYLDQTDGIETARKLLYHNMEVLIVFLTTSREDIWRAVKIHGCFDYVEKSALNADRLSEILDTARKKLRLQAKMLEFFSGKQKVRLPLSRIQYLTAQDKYTCIALEQGDELRYRTTFSSLHSMLKNEARFLLCNRGVLVNMDFIKQTNREIFVMKNGQHFPIRKSDRLEILQTFNDYQFEKLNEQETSLAAFPISAITLPMSSCILILCMMNFIWTPF